MKKNNPKQNRKHRPHTIMQPDGTVIFLTGDELLAQCMTDEKHVAIETLVVATLKEISFNPHFYIHFSENNKDYILHEEIINKVMESKMRPKGQPGISSANFPKASEYWNIGCFGSVWLDSEVNSKIYRVAFNPNDLNFYVTEMK